MSWRGVFTGALALIALQAALQSNESAGRVGGLLTTVARLVESALSPGVAAVPDTRGPLAGAIDDGLGWKSVG